MADSKNVSFDEETLANQFRVHKRSESNKQWLVISLEELTIGVPVQPNTKMYRSVWNTSNKMTVAVKLVGRLNEREVEVLSGIRHKNIVTFHGAIFKPPTNYGVVMELCELGSLFDYIHAENNTLDLAKAQDLSKGIISGVRYLHKDAPDAPIKHNNLTSHEVVLQEIKGILVPKISGFGYARQHSETQQTTSRGTVHIHALLSPERIRGKRSSPESDIYSVAIIMSELVSRKVPFEGYPLFKACSLVTEQGMRPEIPSSCSEKMRKLINDCWEDDPDDRPTAGEVEARLDRMTKKKSTIKIQTEGDETDMALRPVSPRPSSPRPSSPRPPSPRPPSPTVSMFSQMSTISLRPSWLIEEFDITEVSEPFCNSGRIGAMRKAKYQDCPVVVKGVKQFLMDGFNKYMDVVFPIEHKNIVKVLGATSCFIVMEEMPKSLEFRLKKSPITDNNEFLNIAIDVASALDHLHTLPNTVVHGGIYPRNVFLDSEDNAKISDLGYINLKEEVGLSAGVEMYHAPEGKHIHRYGPGVDIYSFGILLIEMRTLNPKHVDKLRSSWPKLHKLAQKLTKTGQEGMYERGRLSMHSIIEELQQLRK